MIFGRHLEVTFWKRIPSGCGCISLDRSAVRDTRLLEPAFVFFPIVNIQRSQRPRRGAGTRCWASGVDLGGDVPEGMGPFFPLDFRQCGEVVEGLPCRCCWSWGGRRVEWPGVSTLPVAAADGGGGARDAENRRTAPIYFILSVVERRSLHLADFRYYSSS